jgi:hypothetical protein
MCNDVFLALTESRVGKNEPTYVFPFTQFSSFTERKREQTAGKNQKDPKILGLTVVAPA